MAPISTDTSPNVNAARESGSWKIVIPGGSGQVGRVLARTLRTNGHKVIIVSRNPESSEYSVGWDGRTIGPWADEIDGADVVINLAGHNVNCRYNKKNREKILGSRMESTNLVGEAIRRARRPPHTWLQASTATIYAHRYDAANDEESGIIGGNEPNASLSWRFSIDVAKAWEQAIDAVELPDTRKIKMRSAMTMSPDAGGIFDVLLRLVRRGLGGRCGNGQQFVSWIHHEDFVRGVCWIIEHPEIDGVLNLASPNPLPNEDFMRSLRDAWGIAVGLPASRWMLEIGAIVLRTETELILKSRRVVPGRLLKSGFEFRYPLWQEACLELCRAWRAIRC